MNSYRLKCRSRRGRCDRLLSPGASCRSDALSPALHSQRGFTLVELLVVITIIGILVALLLPAVQAAREAARKMQCSNNLKQLGLALHGYHDVAHRFPLGNSHASNTDWPQLATSKDNHGSFVIALLPFLEQQNLYDACNFRTSTDYNSVLPGSTTHVYESWIQTLICPSDDAPQYWDGNPYYHSQPSSTKGQKRATSNYSISMGSQRFFSGPYPANAFPGGSSPHGGSVSMGEISGVFSHLAWGAGIEDITDGTSNTIALGEIRPKCSWHARDGWMHPNSLWNATTAPINYPSCPDEPGYDAASCDTPTNMAKYNCEQAFRSAHPGGCAFAFCDGSTHFISQNIDYLTYQKLGDRRDGLPVGEY